MTKVIIVGGMAAGMSAASKAKRDDPSLEVLVYTQEGGVSYGACGLPYYLANHFEDAEALRVRKVEDFQQKGIEVKVNHRVLKIERELKQILVKELATDKDFWVSYDKLVLATGSRSFVPPIQGIDVEGVFTLKTGSDGRAINDYLERKEVNKALIVGAGYIGLEVAEALVQRGKEVTILERAPHILFNFDEEMGNLVEQELGKKGIKSLVGESLISIDKQGKDLRVKTDKRHLNVDFILLSAGVVPNSELAQEAGLELGVRKAIKVNEFLETSDSSIYAAGDCATTFHRLYDKDSWIPLGTTANKQGRIVGSNIAGSRETFHGVVGTGIVKIFGLECARTGLSTREAQEIGKNPVSIVVSSVTKPGYYPGSEKITCKLIAERGTGKILGGQIIGGEGAGKRIDTLATALYCNLGLKEILALDLAYAPPFAPVVEVIQRAAKVLEKKI